MTKRVKQVYYIKDKDNLINYEISQTKDVSTQIEWTTTINSVNPLVMDLTSVPSLYTCSVAATAAVHITLGYDGGVYSEFDGSMLIFSPAESVLSSIEFLNVASTLDDLEVKISIFGT